MASNKKKTKYIILSTLAASLVLSGCGGSGGVIGKTIAPVENATMADVVLNYVNEASGTAQQTCSGGVIDYSNVSDGYVMVQYTPSTDTEIKVQVKGAAETYSYTISPGVWITFPLSEGSGSYQVAVYEKVGDARYAQVLSASFTANLTDEFAPFLRPNYYVNYAEAPNTIATAQKLTEGITDTLEKVQEVYNFVISTLDYDHELAATVQSGYVPNLDENLVDKKGICFDYAALMTGMLRSQNVPCKMVFGYVENLYHAWISVWVDGEGWVDDVIHFDGNTWTMLDPTFASTDYAASVKEYTGSGDNYTAKFFY